MLECDAGDTRLAIVDAVRQQQRPTAVASASSASSASSSTSTAASASNASSPFPCRVIGANPAAARPSTALLVRDARYELHALTIPLHPCGPCGAPNAEVGRHGEGVEGRGRCERKEIVIVVRTEEERRRVWEGGRGGGGGGRVAAGTRSSVEVTVTVVNVADAKQG